MALRGTLKDFGIADIFQLIGHQGKSGVLTVTEKQREVRVFFREGNVVRATTSTRREKHLLGRMLVRAEVLTDEQLNQALEVHKASGAPGSRRRIGDVLVESGLLDRPTLASFYRLQTHETIYQLFLWTNGNYEFNAEEVTLFDDEMPLRSENVLMEGFRQVDEWPAIRRTITSYGLKFDVLVDLDSLDSGSDDDASDNDDFDLDAAFGDGGGSKSGDPRLAGVGLNERKVFQLITPERDVQKIIDLSRLGEFETCKALATLSNNGIVRPSSFERSSPNRTNAIGGGIEAGSTSGIGSAVIRLAVVAGAVAGILVASGFLGQDTATRAPLLGPAERDGFQSQALKNELTRARVEVIRRGLEVYRARYGRYPDSLETLVTRGFIDARDLSFPWGEAYYYERAQGSYRLLRPLE